MTIPLAPSLDRARLPLGRVFGCGLNLAVRARRSLANHGRLYAIMLQRARDQYDQNKTNGLKRDPYQSGSPSPPAEASSQKLVNKPFKKPSTIALAQTEPSNLNAMNSHVGNVRPPTKRTSDGSVKSNNNVYISPLPRSSYSSKTSAQHKPPVGGSVYGRTDALFSENDFDSDVELDVDESPARLPSTISYPTLPAQSSKTKSSVAYPSLQKAEVHTQAGASFDQGHQSGVPPSSVPLPWSSSPPEHHQTPTNANRFLDYGLGAGRAAVDAGSQASSQAAHNAAESVSKNATQTATMPKKRRTLFWLEGGEHETAQVSAGQSVTGEQSVETQATPKRTSDSIYPWNTTASAIKEQQKELRRANREAAKKEDSSVVARASTAQLAKKKTVARPHLSGEQRHVLDLVVESGNSVFFTGSAGTGKSVLLREIIAHLRKKFVKETDRVAITASTGLAACNIGGVTLHSFAGFGLGKEEVPELVKKIKRNQKAKHRWMRTKVLIVDEVSMVDADMFDKLESIARLIRNNGRPFGGIQLVITGDFFQLPPVPENGRMSKFCFEASTWKSAINHTIALHHVFRQKDPEFASMLNEMREGRLTDKTVNAFNSLRRPLEASVIEPTELFPTRSEVDTANNAKMRQLQGGTKTFECRDGGTIQDVGMRSKLLQNCMAPEKLELKIGSQVMLIKNIDETLVNGTLGHVVRFMTESMFDTYDEDEEEYDAVEKKPYEELNPKQQKLKQQMMLTNNLQLLPLVRFRIADGTERELLCHRELWKIELPNGEVQASRSQVPLILAWALSIHKAQGQTLERVKVDLGKVFEKGQAYVALSRAVSMNGLQVLRFDKNKVMAHDRVRTFYANLSRAEDARNGNPPSP